MSENKKNAGLKKGILIAGIVLVCVIIGIGVWYVAYSGKNRQETPGDPDTKGGVPGYHLAVRDGYDDVGVMIMDGEDLSAFDETKNLRITHGTNRYVEGTGAIALEEAQRPGYGTLHTPADISDYTDGSVHVSIYVNDTKYLNNVITLELTSSGSYDFDEISWNIEKHWLKNGWNEIYLEIGKAGITGTPDLSRLNYFRIYSLKGNLGLMIFMDNIYATDTIEDYSKVTMQDEYKETESEHGKMIMSCNTINIFSSLTGMEVTTAKGEYVEGTGAMRVAGLPQEKKVLGSGVIAEAVDISSYKQGNVHLSLYVNDISFLKNYINVELSSSGKCDVDEYNWKVEKADLKSGWNDVFLTFDEASITGAPNLAAINYFRIFSLDVNENLVLIVDNVYANMDVLGDSAYKETESDRGKMIMSCNTTSIFDSFKNMKLTTKKGEYVEGTGALKLPYFAEEKKILSEGILAKGVNISGYAKGSVHISLYINDTSYLKNYINVELSSSGKCDVDEYNWKIEPVDLNNGWNDVYLTFEKASVTGNPNLSAMNYFRMFSLDANENIVLILDNVYATLDVLGAGYYEETESEYGKMIISGNTTNIFSQIINMEVTVKNGEYVEGTGALKTVYQDKDAILSKGKLETPRDISEYANGSIHLSLYVNNVSLLTKEVMFELTSSGTWDKDEYEWKIQRSELVNGWNDIYLKFAKSSKTGSPDLKAINYFRLYSLSPQDGITFIMDNVYATMDTSGSVTPAGGKMILNCDSLERFSNHFNMGLSSNCREGAYGIKALNPGIECYGKFRNQVNISEYRGGGVHISLYVNKKEYLNNSVNFELSSSGTCDRDEYQWVIPVSTLQDGWNELYLSFRSAVRTGKPNLGAINYFRMFSITPTSKMELILDNIYAYPE